MVNISECFLLSLLFPQATYKPLLYFFFTVQPVILGTILPGYVHDFWNTFKNQPTCNGLTDWERSRGPRNKQSVSRPLERKTLSHSLAEFHSCTFISQKWFDKCKVNNRKKQGVRRLAEIVIYHLSYLIPNRNQRQNAIISKVVSTSG